MKTLLIAGHPDLSKSVANATILEEVAVALPDLTIRKLCEVAPGGRFDIVAEQAALADAGLIVWQFPFHWYAMPWFMKQWLDEVFVFGFAHGPGAKLGGKKLLVSVTTGAPEAAYTGGPGSVGDIHDFVAAFESIAKVCGLEYMGAMWVNGMSYAADAEGIARQKAKAREHAAHLVARIREIRA
ncbi:MAG: NAD(P)H-dependent oxidoreductase [Lentisphaeria bacterium]|nr:NAD(P)H-dependent oxidoreductase [Lentisphaeria bacterium]